MGRYMKDFLISVSLLIVIFSTIWGLVIGIGQSYKLCDNPLSKRYQYVIPTTMISCPATRWILEESQIYDN